MRPSPKQAEAGNEEVGPLHERHDVPGRHAAAEPALERESLQGWPKKFKLAQYFD